MERIISKLKEKFEVKEEIEIKYDLEDTGRVDFLPDGKKVRLVIPPEINYYDLVDLFGLIKLGEINYLLATFYFQKDLTEEEKKYAEMFHLLCQPLQDVWCYKIIKNYLQEDEYKEIIQDLVNLYENVKEIVEAPPMEGVEMPEDIKRRLYVSTALILEKTSNADVNLIITGKYKKEWEIYLFWIRHFADLKPDPKYFVKLPKITSAPYEVKIKKSEIEYYEVKKKQ
ncbi:MAG: hypothetical protein QXV73_04335 [Candidatus Micrarchaeia archaeon]